MSLEEVRKRLPIVDSLPTPKSRWRQADQPGQAPTPKWAIWELTLACDQKCTHCGPRAGSPRKDELSTEECLQLVQELADLGVGEVVLIGGEAYLRNDFILIIRAIRNAGMACTMTTGGLNLTAERARAMVEAGISSVTLSIDGLEASHDRVRGVSGSWRRVFQAMRNLRAAGARVACNTQINALTLTELLPLLELIGSEGAHSWQLQITVPHGNAGDHPDLILQPYQMLEVYETLEKVLDRAEQLRVRIWPGNNLGYFGPLEQRLRKSQNRYFNGCTAGKHTLAIESDGSLKNCPSLGGPSNVGGGWREHGIRKVWTDSYQLNYIRQRTLDDLWGYCRECYYAEACMGGCTATSESLLGQPGNNPFCHHRALELAQRGLRERIEFVQAAATKTPFDNAVFRLVTESVDPTKRATQGPERVVEARPPRVPTAG